MVDDYIRRQKSKGRPPFPREALKLTASNNWVHVTCAVWTPEIKFADSKKMEGAEGMGAVAASGTRIETICKLCKTNQGACISCQQCHAPFHVGCAHEAGYRFGFDVTPVKGSRKDMFSAVTVGNETGSLTAAIWCKEHSVKTIVHDMTEGVTGEPGCYNALQLFVSVYKQADLTLTGTARKANLLAHSAKNFAQTAATATSNRRASTNANGVVPSMSRGNRKSSPPALNLDGNLTDDGELDDCQCVVCHVDVSLKWVRVTTASPIYQAVTSRMPNGARPESAWVCHKCFKRAELGLDPVDAGRAEENEDETDLETVPDLWDVIEPPPKTSSINLMSFARSNVPAIPQLPQYKPAMTLFSQNIWNMQIEISNPRTDGHHIFEGKHLGLELDIDPSATFAYIQFFAGSSCGYKREYDVITTEDGSWVSGAKQFMQALIKMVITGAKRAKWQVNPVKEISYISMDDTHKKVLENQHLIWPPIYCPPTAHEMSSRHKYPPQPPPRRQPYLPLPPIGTPHGLPGSFRPPPVALPTMPEGHNPAIMGRPARFYPTPGIHPNMGYHSSQGSPTSVKSPTSPGEPPGSVAAINGASSSPNLRNLMH